MLRTYLMDHIRNQLNLQRTNFYYVLCYAAVCYAVFYANCYAACYAVCYAGSYAVYYAD